MRQVLLDTNLLLLLIVGRLDPAQIQKHKSTRNFSVSDHGLLVHKLAEYSSIVTTPAILTEASNLLGNIKSHLLFAGSMAELCGKFLEIHHPKETIFANKSFARLGYADCSILSAISQEVVLITVDVHLYLQASKDGWESINFYHLRNFNS